MPDLSTLALFFAACFALSVTPGPDMMLVASRSASQGRGPAFASLAGIQAGIYAHALGAALGLSQLLAVVPAAYDGVRYAGAAYLLVLAVQAFRGRDADPAPAPDARARRGTWKKMFRQGLLTNLLNPKVALFVLALFPQFVAVERGAVLAQMLVLATVLNLTSLAVNGLVILAAGRLARSLSGRGRFRRASRLLMGTVFAGLAARLAAG